MPNRKPLGYEKITGLNTAKGFTVPPGASVAVFVTESQPVRWRDDGSNPTATEGMLCNVNTQYTYDGNLNTIKFIETAASATLYVSYFDRADF